MRLKCMASERPEPMLRSIRALTLTHFFMTIWDLNPFEDALKHFETALIKSQTTKLASRTKAPPKAVTASAVAQYLRYSLYPKLFPTFSCQRCSVSGL
ncbi:hypothetical protein RRG08_064838 [Elysia crispata]|uniref:Uncharacterized protein n=1 Tax=Elysia crispata TaxID=231223 RepID=A0AAE0Z2P4_9GAST|nr:hypothetical protein RRG08_064838 [Elysia crispata]